MTPGTSEHTPVNQDQKASPNPEVWDGDENITWKSREESENPNGDLSEIGSVWRQKKDEEERSEVHGLIRTHAVTASRYLTSSPVGPKKLKQQIWKTQRITTLPPDEKATKHFINNWKRFEIVMGKSGDCLGGKWFPSGLLIVSGRTKSRKTVWTTMIAAALWKDSERKGAFVFAEDTPEIYPQLWHILADIKTRQEVEPNRKPEGSQQAPGEELSTRLALKYVEDKHSEVKECKEPKRKKLEAILSESLRETPFALFVGEVREIDDWKPILEFAKTGHRIVATTHAGSVAETFSKLMEAMGCKDRAHRAQIIQAVHGIVNLKLCKGSSEEVEVEDVFPSTWWGTPLAKKQLAAHGLAALVPTGEQHPHFMQRFQYAAEKNWRDLLEFTPKLPQTLEEDRNEDEMALRKENETKARSNLLGTLVEEALYES
jgi:hypothetical protein